MHGMIILNSKNLMDNDHGNGPDIPLQEAKNSIQNNRRRYTLISVVDLCFPIDGCLCLCEISAIEDLEMLGIAREERTSCDFLQGFPDGSWKAKVGCLG